MVTFLQTFSSEPFVHLGKLFTLKKLHIKRRNVYSAGKTW